MIKYIKILSIALMGLFLAAPQVSASVVEEHEIKTMMNVPLVGSILKNCPVIPVFVFDYVGTSEAGKREKEKFILLDQPAPSHSVVFCTDMFIKLSSIPFIMKFSAMVSGVASSMLVLAILVFSFKVFMGQANIRSISFMFFIKVVIVFTVIGSNPLEAALSGLRLITIKDTLVNAPRHFGALIFDTLYVEKASPTSAVKLSSQAIDTITNAPVLRDVFGPKTIPGSTLNLGVVNVNIPSVTLTLSAPTFVHMGGPFQLFDRHIYSVLDMKKIKNAYDSAQSTDLGIATILASMLFAGEFAAMLSIVILVYIMIMVVTLAQAILFFVTANLVLTILMAIAPITLPCMLFPKTAHITRRWFMAIISYTLQPLVFMAFFAVTILLIDKVSDPIRNLGGNPLDAFYAQAWKKISNDCKEGEKCDKSLVKVNLGVNDFSSLFGVDANKESSGETTPTAGLNNSFNAEENRIVQGIKTSITKAQAKNAVTLDVLKIDHKLTPSEKAAKEAKGEGVIEPEDITQATAYIIAVTLLMVVLLAFMKMIPAIVDEMVGKAAPSAYAIVAKVTEPLDKITGITEGVSSSYNSSAAAHRRQLEQAERMQQKQNR
jgi:hypothetical protein